MAKKKTETTKIALPPRKLYTKNGASTPTRAPKATVK